MQPRVASHHSGTRGRIRSSRSPGFRPQVCVRTLAVRQVKSVTSPKLHFTSSPRAFTHHSAGFGPLLPSWARAYTMRYYFLLQRQRAPISPPHCHGHTPSESREKLGVGCDLTNFWSAEATSSEVTSNHEVSPIEDLRLHSPMLCLSSR